MDEAKVVEKCTTVLCSLWSEDNTAIARNIALIVFGLIALPLGIWRTVVAHKQSKTSQAQLEQTTRSQNKQFELAEAAQDRDRYQKAAAMLGDERIPVREAGMFALAALAKSAPKEFYVTVQKLLCAFIWDRSKEQWGELLANADGNAPTSEDLRPVESDIETALSIVIDTRTELPEASELEEAAKWRPALNRGYFVGTGLLESNLRQVGAIDACFQRSSLTRVKLEKAHLKGCDFTEANLVGVDFTNADLSSANISGARLEQCDFSGANVKDCRYTLNTNFQDCIGLPENWVTLMRLAP